MDLTPEQRAAVEHAGPRVAVLGGPGTGKTTTLLARYQLLAGSRPASRILVVCRDRGAAQRFTDAVLPHLVGGFDSLPITTVHGVAHDLVTRSGAPVRLLTRAEQRAMVRSLLAAEQPADWPTLGHFLDRPAFAVEVADALTEVQRVGLTRAAAASAEWQALARFAHRYLAALEGAGRVDATGLLVKALPEAAAQRARFDCVLVDDAHSLPPLGQELLGALAGEDGPFTIAADDGDASGSGAGPLLAVAEPVLLRRGFRVAAPGRLVHCAHPSVEPEAVAGELLAASSRGVPWSQMAVVVRALGRRARATARALARHGIPVVPVPALAVEEPVAGAVLDLLRWVDGDDDALARILTSPLSALEAGQVRALRRDALARGQPIEAQDALAPLVRLRDGLREHHAAGGSAADLVYEVWAGALAEMAAPGRGDGLGAIDDRALDALVALVDGLSRNAERNPGASLRQTLAAVEEGELAPDPWRVAAAPGVHGVTITSIASAAGQEWHTVVVAGSVEGELPHPGRRAPLFDPAVLAGGQVPPQQARRQALVEERQLFDLATSRATGHLIATAAPQPGVLLSRFVEAWPVSLPDLPLAPGQAPPRRAVTAGAAPVWPERRLVLSATQLQTYDDCPLRYAYQYVARAREEAGVHAALGALVHDVLADFLDPQAAHPRTLESLLDVAAVHWSDEIARYRPQVEEARRDFLAMLAAWWEHEGSQGELAPEVLAVERRFEFEIGPHRVVGAIDRIDRVEGGVRVVDYKTGKREPTSAEVAEDLQLALYHLAAERDPELAALGPPRQLQLRYLRSMRAHEQAVTEEHAAATEARVLATAERILTEEFPAAVDANCRTCGFHRLCPLQLEGRQTAGG